MINMRTQQLSSHVMYEKSVCNCKAYKSKKHGSMIYRKDGKLSVGIRVRGGRQIFSFGRSAGLSEQSLRLIGDQVMQKLDEDGDEKEVQEWAEAEAAK